MNANGQNVVHERPTTPDQPSAASAGRFMYASGSRPLEGYTIKRGVGHGGFGEVYYATSDAGKEVALKLIRRNLDVELRGIKQCLNLKHPNLVAIYDIREDGQGDHWVVMEYVAGKCLEDAIAEHPQGLPIDEALAWLHGIAAGVAYLHDHGIVHRDLKPGNLFSDDGRVEIGDYGLSKFISCSRRSGHTESIGTVHYMAPEVAGGRYGKEIDIYALGVILYEMLTGRVPFEGESVGEVLMKHLTAAPDVSMLAEPYRSVVAKALEKDPAKRFQSVTEMVAGLPKPSGALTYPAAVPSGAKPAIGSTPAPIPAQAVDEEPILQAIRHFARQMRSAWDESKFSGPIKLVLLVATLFLLLVSANIWISLLAVYGIYRGIRAIVLSIRRRRRPPEVVSRSVSPAIAPLPLAEKSPQERITDLLGSMLVGAVVAIVMSLVVVIVSSLFSEGHKPTLPKPEQCAWLTLVGILGTWAVLVPAKFWERVQGEDILRRFTMMVAGLGLGAAAYVVAELLMVGLTYDPRFYSRSFRFPAGFYSPEGNPHVLAYMAVFGTLFFLIRWWHQADPLRSTRLGLWVMVVSVLVASIVAGVWGFPESWLVMLACVISVSVQLSSRWLPLAQRTPGQGNPPAQP